MPDDYEGEDLEYWNTHPFAEGYKDGYLKGYDQGIEDGRFQGYKDAKFRAFRAVAHDVDMKEELVKALGEE